MTLGLPSGLARGGRNAAAAVALLALALVPVLHHHEFGAADYPGVHAETRDNAPNPAGGPCLVCLVHHQKAQIAHGSWCAQPAPGGAGSPALATAGGPRPEFRAPRPSRAPPASPIVA